MFSMILPTYDEATNIIPLIHAVRRALADRTFEIIVVDDDSPDGTWQLVDEERSRVPELRLIHRVGRRGLTSAISEGIRAATGDLIGWMDCDFSTPPELLPALLSKIDEGWDVAVASRYVPGGSDNREGSLGRRLASRAIIELARAVLVSDFHDYTSGYIVARRGIFDKFDLRGDYGEYFIDLIFRAHRLGLRIAEVPYALVPRRSGASKTESGFFRKGLKYIAAISRLGIEARMSGLKR